MPPLPDRVPPTLAAIHAHRVRSRWEGRGSTFIGASEAGRECARAIWYAFRWASPPETASPRILRLFATGDIEEARIIGDLRAIGIQVNDFDPETGKQWRSEIQGYVAVKPDAVINGLPEAPQTWHVLECKSANAKTFAAIKSKGVQRAKPEHWLQIQLEMLGEGLKRALYYIVNKDDDEEHVERIKLDAEAANRAVARLVEIAEAPRPPGKLNDDPKFFLCRFCRHKGVCHEGAQAKANCRTCAFSTPKPGGIWRCERWGSDTTPEQQAEGCGAHIFIPNLVNGEQIDADPDLGTITYKMPNGSIWVDGGDQYHAK